MYQFSKRRLRRSALVPRCNRLLSTTAKPVTTKKGKACKLDKSLVKLFIWIVLFGSLLTHVADRRHRLEDMERRCSLKADILRELTERVRGGDTNITKEYIEQELKLVNRMFAEDTGLVMGKMSSLFSFFPSREDRQEQFERAKNESLEDIKGQILAAMNENSIGNNIKGTPGWTNQEIGSWISELWKTEPKRYG